ncbi:MAG: MATE family efflux transporter [Eubacteriales bacterium]|nr:MATE family efflux transporter [Eubacteriales bacterium]
MTIKDVAKNKSFWRSLLTLVIPITIQSFLSNAVNSADVVMIGKVGQTELSAVSLANQFQFLLFGLAYGLNSGITMLVSQYWGKKDTKAIEIVLGIALKIGFVISLIITLSTMFLPGTMMRIYTSDEELIEIGSVYLRTLGPAYLLCALSAAYQAMLRSVERAAKATVFSSCALVLNVFLNAVLIFGLFGLPAMGVKGAALATLIARAVEFILCLADAVSGRTMRFHLRTVLGHNKALTKDYFRFAVPAALGDILWTVAFSTYSVIMGHLNADVVAANSVAVTVRDLCTVIAYAIGGGACVMIGIKIGEGCLEEARVQADLFCWLSMGVGVLTCIVILLIRPFILRYFELTERAQSYLNIMLIISSYYVIGQIMNTLWIGGIFRCGGNTKWGLICDTVTMWGVSVPLGFLSAFVFKFPPMVVYFILCLDEFWKIPIVYKHYKSYIWLKDITREIV